MYRASVFKWPTMFKSGTESVTNDMHRGQVNHFITPENMAPVHELIYQNKRIKVDKIA